MSSGSGVSFCFMINACARDGRSVGDVDFNEGLGGLGWWVSGLRLCVALPWGGLCSWWDWAVRQGDP